MCVGVSVSVIVGLNGVVEDVVGEALHLPCECATAHPVSFSGFCFVVPLTI